jgi:hypothetical protein
MIRRNLANAAVLALALAGGLSGTYPAAAQMPQGGGGIPQGGGGMPQGGGGMPQGGGGMPQGSGGMPPECAQFGKLREEAQQKATLVKAATQNKGDRKGMCTAITRFAAAEATALKFLQDNQVWCGIPAQAITGAKAAHEQTIKFQTMVCTEAPKPKAPTLSDTIGTPSVDTGKNTKTGEGTFDTLTGNPLAK